MKLHFAGLTDVGMARESNEDNFLISTSEPMAVVADGMGGHSSGEVASAFAIQTIKEYYARTKGGRDVDETLRARMPAWPFTRKHDHIEEKRLVQAVMLSNDVIHGHALENPACQGMGTTIVGGYFIETGMWLIHVGDSRAYRIRNGEMKRITRDHSLADEYVQMGILRDDELEYFPYKNVITRAVGLADSVEPDVRFIGIRPGDLYVFCSDGLTDPLSDAEIKAICIESTNDLDQACTNLIEAANRAGGPDNITAVLARIDMV